ncbi:Glycosyl transferase family 2 [Selenomonas sp. GACV-9]|uniref:glycosyltransferase family 2 protein n=1 Tax=Selenomonas sp. GACV-9 TaxID=3158782 RepID=UPI0008F09A34|nr:Glycosyl transferase family 2 [Selenomonas ruminantium]
MVSIIMPALNVAPFVEDCINSVLTQSFSDLEILVIDAGSTDGTKTIVERLSLQDKRIRMVSSPVRSYGYQMNLGVKNARGKFIFILESDDMMVENSLEFLVDYMTHDEELDFVKGYPIAFYDIRGGVRYDIPWPYFSVNDNILGTVFDPSENPKMLSRDVYLWLGLYRREFLENICFNETSGAAFQDQGFLLQTLSSSKRAMYVDIPVYRYRQNNPGSSIYNPKGFSYILQEYGLNERFLPNLSSDWKHFFYLRMLQQTLARFQVMGLSGTFWDEAGAALQEIKARLSDAIEKGLLQVNRFNEEQRIFWDDFQQDIRQPFLHFAGQYAEKKRDFAEIAEWARGHKVVVYGAGNWGRFIQAFLLIHHLGDLQCFADQSEKLQGTEVQGTVVFSPEEALRLYVDAHYLIANSRHREEIREYLMRGGVPEEHILSPQITIDTMMFLADFTKEES